MTKAIPFLLGMLTAAAMFAAIAVAGAFESDDEPAAPPSVRTSAAVPGGAATGVADIYARVSPGVVFVSARGGRAEGPRPRDFPFPPFEDPRVPPVPQPRAAGGSGFLIDDKGSIVTNQHVVDGANRVTVRFGEDGEPVDAKVLGEDPSSDIALLEVDPDDIPSGVAPLPLAASEGVRPGDAAIAIGSPFGLEGTVTTGIISALDREITAPSGFTIAGVLQTDAAINPGNSGGPLLDAQGRVIGVNSQIAAGIGRTNSGVGFAVPIDEVKKVVPQLREDGKVERAWLGVSSAERPGRDGALIAMTTPGGPAARAGLRRGDLITKLGDTEIHSPSDLSAAVLEHQPGDRVQIVFERGGKSRTEEVRLGERPDQAPRA